MSTDSSAILMHTRCSGVPSIVIFIGSSGAKTFGLKVIDILFSSCPSIFRMMESAMASLSSLRLDFLIV